MQEHGVKNMESMVHKSLLNYHDQNQFSLIQLTLPGITQEDKGYDTIFGYDAQVQHDVAQFGDPGRGLLT